MNEPGKTPSPVRNSSAATALISFYQWISHLTGIDRAIAFTVMARGWSSIAGIITLALIARYLSLPEQGYYYTFWSLVALQIVFELGFTTVIVQLAAHETANLHIAANGEITGDPVAHQRLASVIQKSMRWYAVAAVSMIVTLLPTGIYFFRSHPQPGVSVHWVAPWCMAVLIAMFNFQIDPLFSLLEGCGYVPQVARTRLWQAMTGSILAWVVLLMHHGLFAPAALILGQAIAGSSWLISKRKFLFHLFRYHCGENRILWKEVWPFQWRIAVSWLSGYFIFQIFNPVMFTYWGAAEAGKMGMSLNIANSITAVTLSWINTKAAPFGKLIAQRKFAELDHIFFRTLAQSVSLSVFGCLSFYLVYLYLYRHHILFAMRLLPPLPLALLLLAPPINQVVGSEAIYLRAHKQEKFLWNSVIGAICVTTLTLFLVRRYGALGIIAGCLGSAIIVGLCGGTWTFLKYRRLWHAE